MRFIFLFALIGFITHVSPTEGAKINSEIFHKICKDSPRYCSFYVRGIHDGVKLVGLSQQIQSGGPNTPTAQRSKMIKLNRRLFGCGDQERMSQDQKVKIWMLYLDKNPQELHFSPEVTYFAALKTAFPCN